MISDFVLPSNSEDMPETAIDEGLYLVGRFGDTPCFTGIQKNTLHIGIEDSKIARDLQIGLGIWNAVVAFQILATMS